MGANARTTWVTARAPADLESMNVSTPTVSKRLRVVACGSPERTRGSRGPRDRAGWLLASVLVAGLALIVSCSDSTRTEIGDVEIWSPTEFSIVLECASDAWAEVEEREDEIRIEASIRGRRDEDCGTTVLVELDAPLGNRAVYDVVAGDYVELD